MEKLIITRWKGRILTALFSGRTALQISLEPVEDSSLLNNIYVGRVQTVASGINAAFVEFEEGQTGYLSLSEYQPRPLNRPEAKKLASGDEILVQVARDKVKTKAPVLTGLLTLTGRYLVLTPQKPGINFSSKLNSRKLKEDLKPLIEQALQECGCPDWGVIVRTNAGSQTPEIILRELKSLAKRCGFILEQAPRRAPKTYMYRALPGYICALRDSYEGKLEAIVTDQEDCFLHLQEYLTESQPEDLPLLTRYSDPLVSLSKVCSLEKAIAEATNKRVWLKSGGYLVIEPTEAMTVIDVNTGKYPGKKDLAETILRLNLEAAWEIGRQLRLRNLSGIIVADFIDMERPEDNQLLMKTLAQAVALDPVKTTVVEMTKLGLVELTRKKVRRPLAEQLRENEKNENSR